jgi:hypothetical protein
MLQAQSTLVGAAVVPPLAPEVVTAANGTPPPTRVLSDQTTVPHDLSS